VPFQQSKDAYVTVVLANKSVSTLTSDPEDKYQRIPQCYVIIRPKSQHTGLKVPVSGGRMPISAYTDVVQLHISHCWVGLSSFY
jgi:hypothetical protein